MALVGLDLAYSLEVRLEVQENGGWVTVSGDKARFYYPEPGQPACPSEPLRLTLDNNKPIGETVRVVITYQERSGVTRVHTDETVSLGRFEVVRIPIEVPAEAFVPLADDSRPSPSNVYVTAQAGSHWTSTCLEEPA